MQREMRPIVILGAVALLVVFGLLGWLFWPKSNGPVDKEILYTDTITGQPRSAFPDTNSTTETPQRQTELSSLIAIAGIQEFYDDIDGFLADRIQDQLVDFIRAKSGTGSNQAWVKDGVVTKTSTKPLSYNLTLVIGHPEATYSVTINVPDSNLRVPDIKFSEEAQ